MEKCQESKSMMIVRGLASVLKLERLASEIGKAVDELRKVLF